MYVYNLRNRLKEVKVTTDGVNWDVTTYKYNEDGIRVEKNDNGTITRYLVDSHNHTGYAQVLEETRDTSPEPQVTTFTIGDDIIAQATEDTGTTEFLLYDGHGSTRQLVNSSAAVVDAFSYDGYGVMLGGNPTPSNPAVNIPNGYFLSQTVSTQIRQNSLSK